MKKLIGSGFVCLLLTACGGIPNITPPVVNNVNDIAPYPPAKAEYQRRVIYLVPEANEADLKVELIISKTMGVDCNVTHLTGSITEMTLPGWGYPYYQVEVAKNAITTRMGCPANSERLAEVTLNHPLNLLAYNSRLPIVVYVPAGLHVSYQLWHRSGTVYEAQP